MRGSNFKNVNGRLRDYTKTKTPNRKTENTDLNVSIFDGQKSKVKVKLWLLVKGTK